ncbi:ATP phosphoribosyltransferase [Turicimonas muris]|uniref:ATP phosphoribosyltransferase n=2 Tax=Turicimonas muris TaxID=1796652 RepID=A0A227KIK6_9BURK|nr:ATP phosphoribosyltransferase [Turicimonas muris]ANU67166.1 ATP phosphoribosyltransferase [Burkholderiales bacterium YL45]MBS4769054.1 ATP phosphoribosyltransferase [Burkholderiales bacterium]MBS4846635.1 ATP phosphoribosyltransferase [Burkholderiales bacterium]OXE47791.1 ATP phosphoribosyltransferase [Turicimonas muris]QQQ96021.1 ATP phosphoribosyltransferase [Turicimonas muris]
MITIALSKGRIFTETLPFLAAAGVVPLEDPETSRKLLIGTNHPDIRIVVVRASDVPTYVQYGAADMGVAGKDSLYEHGGAGLYVPLDLNIAKCRMCVACPRDFDYHAKVRRGARLRIATKFMKYSRNYFAKIGVHVDLIKLYGSMELAPIAGLSDAIVDLVSSGATLRANNLVEVEQIDTISSRLIVGQAAMKLKTSELLPIIDTFEKTVKYDD